MTSNLLTINVEGGTASNLVVGVPFAWHGGVNGATAITADTADGLPADSREW